MKILSVVFKRHRLQRRIPEDGYSRKSTHLEEHADVAVAFHFESSFQKAIAL
jgi:hypothetical protein